VTILGGIIVTILVGMVGAVVGGLIVVGVAILNLTVETH
jgi:hypothetical protein